MLLLYFIVCKCLNVCFHENSLIIYERSTQDGGMEKTVETKDHFSCFSQFHVFFRLSKVETILIKFTFSFLHFPVPIPLCYPLALSFSFSILSSVSDMVGHFVLYSFFSFFCYLAEIKGNTIVFPFSFFSKLFLLFFL